MRKLRGVLRLKVAGLPSRQIGASLGIGGTTQTLERGALKPLLPAEPFEFATWKHVKAGFDYHVEVDKHY